ncbi:GNAT family N-acetyltransferase [Burkholderia catarinensis]|uniref:GNAT family N-acetyltransferase n=1 Tax=Burkholderia catarinensis TaxID=1108140 RepID=UPI001FE30CAE|nr:GNAT family N-acetyltransferase [Burkholderia catarinensis]
MNGRLAGFVAISESWNGMAEIGEIAVDRACRQQGVGRLLLSAAETWARNQRFDCMRLETQSNNVQACRIYACAGFILGGMRSHAVRRRGERRRGRVVLVQGVGHLRDRRAVNSRHDARVEAICPARRRATRSPSRTRLPTCVTCRPDSH